MNELASPPRPWDTEREPKARTLFVIEDVRGPHDNDWTSEPY